MRPAEILLVEDEYDDVEFTRRSFEKARIDNRIHHVASADEAWQFLRRQKPHEGAPRPDIILLDLDLPRISGGDLLRQLKADQETASIPVVILSARPGSEAREVAHQLGAESFLEKPIDSDAFALLARRLQGFSIVLVTGSSGSGRDRA